MKNLLNKMSVLFATLCCVLFFTAGCNKAQEKTAEAQTLKEAVERLEAEGKYSKLDRSDSIPGPYEDKNGIRDDIDAYIDSIDNITKEQRGALRQSAYASNYVLQPEFDLSNPNHIAKRHVLIDGVVACSDSLFGDDEKGDRYLDEIDAFTYNTKKRMEAYLKYEKTISGTAWRMTDGECDETFVK